MGQPRLVERHQSEIEFHDKKYSARKKKSLYDLGFTETVFNEMLYEIGDLTGKRIVDFGCGSGWLTEILLRKGAEVWAFDISSEAVRKTESIAEKLGACDRLHAGVMPAENLDYPDDFFDCIVGVAILHHLELAPAISEIHRVLRKGGIAYFMEPLGHNPLLNFYRWMTPNLRSPDERPLLFEDFELLRRNFAFFRHKEYYLLTLLSAVWYLPFQLELPLKISRDILLRLDQKLLRQFSFLRRFCWYTILTMRK